MKSKDIGFISPNKFFGKEFVVKDVSGNEKLLKKINNFDFEKKNTEKYGEKSNDLISKIEKSYGGEFAALFCLATAAKYQIRINNGKAREDGEDEAKIADYLHRYNEIYKLHNLQKIEFEEFLKNLNI